MEIITKLINESIYIPTNIKNKVKDDSFCILDIETTGFNKKRDFIILIGLLYRYNNSIKITQLFASNPKNEYQLLLKFKEISSAFSCFITYNGDNFDIPFINEKMKFYNIDYSVKKSNNIDLLKVVRSNKEILGIANCRLKSVEQILGIQREDKISGKESVKLYWNYVKDNNENVKSMILKHNFDDIYYLGKILKLYDLIDNINTIVVNLNLFNTEFYLSINLSNCKIVNNMLYVEAKTPILNIPNQIFYEEAYTIDWRPDIGYIKLAFQTYEGHLSTGKKCYYIDKSDYNYNLNCIDSTNYNLPNHIILISEEKKFIKENIKNLLPEILIHTFSNNNF